MSRLAWRSDIAWLTALLATVCFGSAARGEVIETTGSVRSTLVQFAGPFPVQSDLNLEIVPLTIPKPPATARARLDRVLKDGTTTAAGQVVTVLDDHDAAVFGPGNDVGLDLGAFADDDLTGWFAEGVVEETRSLVFHPSDFGEVPPGSTQAAQSRVRLSGVLLVSADDLSSDLSDVEANLTVSVTQEREGQGSVTVLAGEIALVGGPGGKVEIGRASGAFEGAFLTVVDFTGVVPGLPLVQAVLFTGLELPFDYEVVIDEQFDLTLSVRSQLFTEPNGTGAAAVFGLPQEGIADVLNDVKHDESGAKMVDVISQHVDTTGQAYEQDDGPLAGLLSVCGLGGAPLMVLPFITGGWVLSRRRGRRRKR